MKLFLYFIIFHGLETQIKAAHAWKPLPWVQKLSIQIVNGRCEKEKNGSDLWECVFYIANLSVNWRHTECDICVCVCSFVQHQHPHSARPQSHTRWQRGLTLRVHTQKCHAIPYPCWMMVEQTTWRDWCLGAGNRQSFCSTFFFASCFGILFPQNYCSKSCYPIHIPSWTDKKTQQIDRYDMMSRWEIYMRA